MTHQKLRVFLRENTMGRGSDSHIGPQIPAQLERQGRFCAANRAAYPYGESASAVVAVQGNVPVREIAWMCHLLVRMAVVKMNSHGCLLGSKKLRIKQIVRAPKDLNQRRGLRQIIHGQIAAFMSQLMSLGPKLKLNPLSFQRPNDPQSHRRRNYTPQRHKNQQPSGLATTETQVSQYRSESRGQVAK